MMMKRFVCWAVASLVVALAASAEPWSLERCIAHALSHNLTIKARELQEESGRQDITSAKDAFLPNLSAGLSQSFNFGRGLTADNTYADRNTSNTGWNVNLSVPLFQGLQDFRRLDMSKASLQQLLLQTEATRDDITLNIISQYLQVLYQKEVMASAESQVGLSAFEVERQSALVDQGKAAESDLWEAQAQAARDRLTLVNAQNDTKTALITLANLLQLSDVADFDVLPMDEGEPIIPSPESVYSSALVSNNGLLASRQSVIVADKNIKVAQSGYIPKLSFSASASSSYYKLSGMPAESFSQQMRHNYSTYLGFSLSIPIFDGFSTRNSVRSARLRRLQAQLEVEQKETDLYKTIQLAYYEALGAQNKYLTSGETLEKTLMSFEAVKEKYSLGRATAYEFEQAKNNLFSTRVNRIQSHYEYLLRYRILLFYQNGRR